MARAGIAARGKRRENGHVRKRGNSYQVLVYAGIDPVTGKPNYLTESTTDERQVEAIKRRLLTEVDEQQNPQTKGTLGAAVEAWLRVHDADPGTLDDYEVLYRRHIQPVLGEEPIRRVSAHTLEQLYAQLRRCRDRCRGESFVEHRIDGEHECRIVKHKRPPGRPPAAGYPPHDCKVVGCRVIECRPHVCQPLSAARIRKIHVVISGALSAAVRWEWIRTNPAANAKQPRQKAPQPEPPSAEEAARIIAAAWERDEGWGTFVWLVMVTGMRRAEILALRWRDLDLPRGVLEIRRNYLQRKGRSYEKDTKTHQMRRISLDATTVEVLQAHHARYETLVESVGVPPDDGAFLFSREPTHDRPYNPDTVSHRYIDMCAAIGIDSHLHALRHYAATELLTAGVDLRTVAGRLGHGGGGATTLRVYAAWVNAADQKAAEILGSRIQLPRGRSRRHS